MRRCRRHIRQLARIWYRTVDLERTQALEAELSQWNAAQKQRSRARSMSVRIAIKLKKVTSKGSSRE